MRGVHYWSLNEFVLDLCCIFSVWELQKCFTLYCCYFVFQSHYVWFSYYNILFCSICIFALGHYSIMHVLFIYERGSSRLLKCQWNCFRFILYFFSVRITELLHSILVLFCYFQSHYMRFGYYSILFFFILVVELSMNSVSRHFSVWELQKYFTLHCWYFVFSINLYAI